MREALVSVFGQDGAVVVQYIVTFLIILVLVGGAFWLVRRYTSGRVNLAGRGRLPRLAVIDALSVDKRRRLVLVRRDNVEHLLLIGGPSDIVVEPSISRARVAPRPGQVADRAPAPPAVSAPQPAPQPPPQLQRTAAVAALRARAIRSRDSAEPASTEEPIPFPPRRPQPRHAEPRLAEPRQPEPRPVRNEPKMVAAPAAPVSFDDEPAEAEAQREPGRPFGPTVAHHAAPPQSEPAAAIHRPPAPIARPYPQEEPAEVVVEEREAPLAEVETSPRKSAFAPPAGSGHAVARPALPQAGPQEPTEEPKRPPPRPPKAIDDDDADTVSNLEKDMARLLGQISSTGSS